MRSSSNGGRLSELDQEHQRAVCSVAFGRFISETVRNEMAKRLQSNCRIRRSNRPFNAAVGAGQRASAQRPNAAAKTRSRHTRPWRPNTAAVDGQIQWSNPLDESLVDLAVKNGCKSTALDGRMAKCFDHFDTAQPVSPCQKHGVKG